MKVDKTIFTGKEFYYILKFFAKQVGNRAYDKMDYSKWKVMMNQWTHDDATCSIDMYEGYSSRGNLVIEFELINHNYDTFYFTANDCSFGSFLSDMYNGAWKMEEIMQGTSSTTYSKTNTTYNDYGGQSITYNGTVNSGIAVGKSDYWNTAATVNNFDSMSDKVSKIESEIEKLKGKGNNMKGFNFDFGFCTDNHVKMSPYGLAIMNTAGTYVAYDAKTDNIVDVDCFNFDGGKYMLKMPVAIKDIKKGDVVMHNRIPMFVTDVTNGIKVVDIREGEKKEIMPVTNMFGFNFVTKVICIFDNIMGGMNADNPFGNMLPFFMMDGTKGDNDAMLMCMMMQGQSGCGDIFSNPMMMYFMMKDGKNSDMLPLMMMMNMNKPAVEHECKCGGGCTDHGDE